MDAEWERTFRERMRRFHAQRPPRAGDVAVSIKIRVTGGCFHREHSLNAYALIDKRLDRIPNSANLAFEEHESGPELLVYLAVATAGITLAKSIIDLITAIVKARSEGIKKGDKPSEPVEVIVRRVGNGREYQEQVVVRIGHQDCIDEKVIETKVTDALKKLVKEDDMSGRGDR